MASGFNINTELILPGCANCQKLFCYLSVKTPQTHTFINSTKQLCIFNTTHLCIYLFIYLSTTRCSILYSKINLKFVNAVRVKYVIALQFSNTFFLCLLTLEELWATDNITEPHDPCHTFPHHVCLGHILPIFFYTFSSKEACIESSLNSVTPCSLLQRLLSDAISKR